MNGYTSDSADSANEVAHPEGKKVAKKAAASLEMKAEVKHLERSKNEHGKNRLKERKVKTEEAPQDDWSSLYALCIVHQLDRHNKEVAHRELQINSEHLKSLLKDVVVNYPGNPCASPNPCLSPLPYGARCLFFYRKELQAEGLRRFEGNAEALAHLALLQEFIEEEFEEAIANWEGLVTQGLINFSHLWTIFCPGSLVVGQHYGQPCVNELQSTQQVMTATGCEFLHVQSLYMDYDGERFGLVNRLVAIPKFEGYARITALDTYPLSSSANVADIKTSLIARGKKFENYAGQHCQRYEGVAFEKGERQLHRFYIPGTVVMIDHKTFNRSQPDRAVNVTRRSEETITPNNQIKVLLNDDEHDDDDDVDDEMDDYDVESIPSEEARSLYSKTGTSTKPLSEYEQLIASPLVRGFSFNEKRWLEFALDKLQPVLWNADCFKQLVLQESQKNLVRALVAQHAAGREAGEGFDDIVKGKGKGLVLVLHGPPGTGKTLTAEAVAELVERPLYVVSAGDLGTDPENLEHKLKETLDLASTWNAVLLIDEADIFLEQRSLHDIQRNSLVSIFLRVLEYYEGILFLTSNRISSFDDAMKSRIHMPLRYYDLSEEGRKVVWKNFLAHDKDCDVNEEGYNELSRANINGRQIKNVVKTSRSLASYNKEKLDVKKLKEVVDIQVEFERQLGSTDFKN